MNFSGKQVSSAKALDELGWEPTTSFEEGVRRYIEWYQEAQQQRTKQWVKVDDLLRA